MNIQLLLFAPLFIIAIFLAFYIPGSITLRKLHLTSFHHIILSSVLGMVLWGWQGFVFGFLGIRWATYLYLIAALIFWLRTDEKNHILSFLRNRKKFQKPKFDLILTVLVIVGTLLQLVSVFLNGIQQPNGLSFCCGVPDSLYHIALTNQLVTAVPPTEPGAAGLVVHNYHYLGNLVSADLIRVFHLPLIATQYQYLTVLLSLLIGLTAVVFGELLKLKKSYTRWLVFFLYFSGDITFLLLLFFGAGLNFSMPNLENALWLWISPPRVFAIVTFIAALSFLLLWLRRPTMLLGIIVALVLSSLVSFKIYVGAFMAVGVASLGIYYLFTRKFNMILPLLLTVVLSAILYLPVNANSGGIVFVGPWLINNFIAGQPAASLQHIEQARLIYLAHRNWFGVFFRFEIWYTIAYFVFVFGTIVLGVFHTRRSLSLFPKALNIFLIPAFLVCIILGSVFFEQAGGGNSSQFLITVDIFGSLYAALACYYWLSFLRGTIRYAVIFVIIFLTIPRVFYTAYQDITSPSFIVNNNQLQALTYLKMQTPASSVILVDNLSHPQRKTQTHSKQADSDKRTWVGNYSYYISFLADRSLFIDGDTIVGSNVWFHGISIDKRVAIQNEILKNTNLARTQQLLHTNHIAYLYLQTNAPLAKHPPFFMSKVFNNATVTILKVNGS